MASRRHYIFADADNVVVSYCCTTLATEAFETDVLGIIHSLWSVTSTHLLHYPGPGFWLKWRGVEVWRKKKSFNGFMAPVFTCLFRSLFSVDF